MPRTVLLALALPALASAQPAATPDAPPARQARPAAAKEDKLICRSTTEIGSLVASHKECKTRREWDAERHETQDRLSDCVNTGSATGAHC